MHFAQKERLRYFRFAQRESYTAGSKVNRLAIFRKGNVHRLAQSEIALRFALKGNRLAQRQAHQGKLKPKYDDGITAPISTSEAKPKLTERKGKTMALSAEKILEIVTAMLTAHDAEAKHFAPNYPDWALKGKEVVQFPHRFASEKSPTFYGLAAQLLVEAATRLDKEKGKDRMSMAALGHMVKRTSGLRVAGIYEREGKYCICDGYTLVRLNEDFPSIEHAEEPEQGIDPDKALGNLPKSEIISLPTLAELKRHIATVQGELRTKGKVHRWEDEFKKHPIAIGGGVTWVNPIYLLDIMQILPGCVAYKPQSDLMPVYLSAPNGDGCICPVSVRNRPKPNTETEAAS